MNKKHTLKKTVALLLSLGLTVGATGCNFLVTDNEEDLKQIVATVDISGNLENATVKAGVKKLIDNKGLSTDIPKRDLVAYFLNVGMTYVQNYGYSYADTFNLLMDNLINNKIMAQYAVSYYIEKGLTAEACLEYVANEQNKEGLSPTQKSLLQAHPEVLTMQYFLTENGADEEAYNEAVYGLKKSLNDSLDTAEKNYIKAEDDAHTHEESRTTPTNVNTETGEYIPENYDIYTGRNALDSCGEYEKVDGSTATTRKKAYNTLLSNLQAYGLITESEDTAVFTELNYYYIELSSTLSSALVNKYLDGLKEEAIEALGTKKNGYEYVAKKYTEIMEAQGYSYTKDSTAFETALDGLSDNSFVLYGQEGFGFIYNILLPFSASQEQQYAAAKNKGLTQDEIFNKRKEILANVQAKDLRSDWFGEDEHTNYSYVATGDYFKKEEGVDKYLFFENNMTKTDEYESLSQYLGKYPYNGTATQENGEWKFEPNKLGIGTEEKPGFIQEMQSYIDYAVGRENAASGKWYEDYNATKYTKDNGEVDYSKFIYYTGKVNLTNTNAKDYFYKGSVETEDVNDSYAALSAVNELMFAYSTDPGCLNSYMGYAVSPYKTNFVPEFEYAAQAAISGADFDGDGVKDIEGGVGTYVVAPSDYGWHIIYVTFVYEADGNVYGKEFNVGDVEKEGTFSNLFYESLKSTSATNYTQDKQKDVLNKYKTSATRFVDRYQDLLDLDK